MKIPRAEAMRQIRARAPELVEDWIRRHEPGLPEEIELQPNEHMHVSLCFMPIASRPRHPERIICDGVRCSAAMEFSPGSSDEFIAATLARKGWDGGPLAIFCPRCKPTVEKRN